MKQNPIIAVAQIKYFDRGNSNLHKIKKYISEIPFPLFGYLNDFGNGVKKPT